MSFPLVILAAGLSSRYGHLKQVDPLGPSGESIMTYNMYDAARAGFDSFLIVVQNFLVFQKFVQLLLDVNHLDIYGFGSTYLPFCDVMDQGYNFKSKLR